MFQFPYYFTLKKGKISKLKHSICINLTEVTIRNRYKELTEKLGLAVEQEEQ